MNEPENHLHAALSGLKREPRRERNRFLFLCLLLFWNVAHGPGTLAAQETFVPLDHQVYPLLQRAETLGLFSSYAMRFLPLTRTVVGKLLQKMQKAQGRLSGADQALLRQMILEFRDPGLGEPEPAGGEIHLYRFEEGRTQLFFDARVLQTFRFSRNALARDDENISETLVAGSVRGRHGEHLYWGLNARNTAILGETDARENFDPRSGRILSTVGSTAFSDQATGYVALRFGRLGLAAGRMQVSWGSGLTEQLALAAVNEPMDQIRLTVEFAKWRFSYFHANLQGIASQRYLAGHRIDLHFWPAFQLGLYETVVYGGRGAEPGYLNPLVPYHIIEHQLGDLDNNVLGFDWTWIAAAGFRFYGEIFIDDLSFDQGLGTYWGNKLAYLLGVHWAQPAGLKNAEIFGSFTRVDPFVYTHRDSVNVYSHYGTSLGSRLGPNAERWRAGIRFRPLRDALWRFSYEYTRQGKGDLFRPHRFEDGISKGYLSGELERDHTLRANLRFQFRQDVFLGFALLYRRRISAALVPGENRWERVASFFLDINY